MDKLHKIERDVYMKNYKLYNKQQKDSIWTHEAAIRI